MNKHRKILIIATVIFLAAVFVFLNFYLPFNKSKPLTYSTNAQTYQIISPENAWPKFKTATIDPLDVHPGNIQKMKVVLEDKTDVVSVVAEIETDHGVKTVNLTRIEIAQAVDLQKFVYEGEWAVYDTHSKKYHTTFRAKNADGEENSITLAWSDPCTPPLNGNWTLDGNCSISGVSGVDNGNYTNVTYTLTIQNGATFAFNSGKSMTITSGAIAVATGGQIKQTNLWVYDNDGDKYSPNISAKKAQDSQPAGYSRSYQIVGTSDCNDSNASVWQNLYGYRDGDGDGYGAGGQWLCSGSSLPGGYVSNGDDCCDNDAENYPGQSAFFTYKTGCGNSYDFNCDGWEEPRWYGQANCQVTGQTTCGTSGLPNWFYTSDPGCGNGGYWGTGCVSNGNWYCDLQWESRTQACH